MRSSRSGPHASKAPEVLAPRRHCGAARRDQNGKGDSTGAGALGSVAVVRALVVLFGVVLGAACVGVPVHAAPPAPDDDLLPPTETTVVETVPAVGPSTTLVPVSVSVPPGCPTPTPAAAVFVGRLESVDARTGRFSVEQMRAGSLAAFQVGALVDVDYDDETRFLEPGSRYLVGVAVGPVTGRLVSKVREPAPRFGGNQVVALDPTTSECPVVEDPVRTLNVDGSSVESGVLTPLFEEPMRLLRAVLLPAAWALALLVALGALRWALVGLVRGVGAVTNRRPPVSGR